LATPERNAPLRHAGTLVTGQRIELDRTHARGLRFREINPKEAFTIVDHAGSFFRASLIELRDDGGAALVYEAMPGSTESPAHITLLCAVLARQRMLGVVQKATELGVMRIVPVLSERSVQRSGLSHEKAHAWPGQALRASRQCRRASVPEVSAAVPLADALADEGFQGASLRFHLDDHPGGGTELPAAGTGPSRVAFAVGPEGGFTDEERRLLGDRGAVPLRLGGRILRAETAVLVGLTLLQRAYGDL
jgi:16S rRNA (uracil1498-N3)-methyltransferase